MLILFLELMLSAHAATAPSLVDLRDIDATIRISLELYKPDKKRPALYPVERCLVRKPVADALARVQSVLRLQSRGLKVVDCYRPKSTQDTVGAFSNEPSVSGRHVRGGSVDLVVVDGTGTEVRAKGLAELMRKEGFSSTASAPRHF